MSQFIKNVYRWIIIVILTTATVLAMAADNWLPAVPDYNWTFPADHWSHPGYQTEWWYFTGHLQVDQDPARRFGFQFTFFRIGLTPESSTWDSEWATNNLIMGHASVTDLESGKHYFSEILYREIDLLGGFGTYPDSIIAWSRAPVGSGGIWQLTWTGTGFRFSVQDDAQQLGFTLEVTPAKQLVFQGPQGYSRKGKGPSAASQYYSYTRLATRGRLYLGDESYPVSGTSWMDREFGSNQLDENQVGWDWFSLQLEDGREIMLYHLRDSEGNVDFARSTLVEDDGRVRYLDPDSWRLKVTDSWRSEQTNTEYPVGWRLSLPGAGLDLQIRALLVGQENISRQAGGLFYWEGAVEVLSTDSDGQRQPAGQGYVELTGYGEGNRPPI